ncbi:ATP-binding protein, partial [Escherichia coli]|nr:ATP-binding protein [Escherichia coli]
VEKILKIYSIAPNVDENGFWEGIGKSFKNLSQALWEIIDNAISNLLSNPKSFRQIIITFKKTSNGYLIRIEDSGTGILD